MSVSRSHQQMSQVPEISPLALIGGDEEDNEPITSLSPPTTFSSPILVSNSVTISPLNPVTHFTTPKFIPPATTIISGDDAGDYDVQVDDEDAFYYPELSTTDDPSPMSPTIPVSEGGTGAYLSRHRPPPPPPSSRHQKLFGEPDEEEDEETVLEEESEVPLDASGLYRRLTDEDIIVVVDNNDNSNNQERSPSLSSALSRVANEESALRNDNENGENFPDDPVNNALSRLMGASMAAAQVQAAAVQAAAAAGLDHYDAAIRFPLTSQSFTSERSDSVPLKKLSVDLIKTYKQINEVSANYLKYVR